jgi:hypothetical protein
MTVKGTISSRFFEGTTQQTDLRYLKQGWSLVVNPSANPELRREKNEDYHGDFDSSIWVYTHCWTGVDHVQVHGGLYFTTYVVHI